MLGKEVEARFQDSHILVGNAAQEEDGLFVFGAGGYRQKGGEQCKDRDRAHQEVM